jgi:hypothetical protein
MHLGPSSEQIRPTRGEGGSQEQEQEEARLIAEIAEVRAQRERIQRERELEEREAELRKRLEGLKRRSEKG